ncbi:MAG: hypothetical protein MJ181_10275 [Treponema sp.]|nr:hypothetical protein [Treponema sp.]
MTFLLILDWVYNGDKGIASINFETEMGQHCLVNPMQCNLMFDYGTCIDQRLPHGLIDWINCIIICSCPCPRIVFSDSKVFFDKSECLQPK